MSEGPSSTTPVTSVTLMAHVRALGNPRMVHPGQILKKRLLSELTLNTPK